MSQGTGFEDLIREVGTHLLHIGIEFLGVRDVVLLGLAQAVQDGVEDLLIEQGQLQGERQHLARGQASGDLLHASPSMSGMIPQPSSPSSLPFPAILLLASNPVWPPLAVPGEHLQELSHVPKPQQRCQPLQCHQGRPRWGRAHTSLLENRWDRSI